MGSARPGNPTTSEGGAHATTADPRGSDRRRGAGERLAKGLGWFSIGLGVPQVLAPGRMNRLIGV
ncbi:MAG TPA: hypothetical protein VGR26_12245, partial [Acidimicrobiales bacterium]|nr:hypothetical protein [Acidimicrobiales bacterium]